MAVDTASAINAVSAGSVGRRFAVAMLVKAQNAQRLEGAEALRLIDSASPQSTRTADGHISVRA